MPQPLGSISEQTGDVPLPYFHNCWRVNYDHSVISAFLRNPFVYPIILCVKELQVGGSWCDLQT